MRQIFLVLSDDDVEIAFESQQEADTYRQAATRIAPGREWYVQEVRLARTAAHALGVE